MIITTPAEAKLKKLKTMATLFKEKFLDVEEKLEYIQIPGNSIGFQEVMDQLFHSELLSIMSSLAAAGKEKESKPETGANVEKGSFRTEQFLEPK